ncbi:Vitamin B12 transporter BtuB precursor [Sporomusa ovata DSM 2662]|uniref:TonB-dependent receptor Outer membrane receptor for ferrienterochelin and colicins n=1 Tax=Sporomusa ovata TaxID=2378 RepID=A0A0U1KRX9_9FIRM|nr:TonB-dependent receptor [Sporomusa ovata]EQB24983.1 vitamin B12 transporter BtuB [Sporomusa ovata DSM 2662]CQR70186.1 TonB-dependent receptor; Outer membrane receptor for ferrienterochelin and colicins [Sporomusa ovata]
MHTKKKVLTCTLVLGFGICGVFSLAQAEEIASFDLEQIIVTADAEKQAEKSEGSIVSTKIVKPGKAMNVSDLLTDLVGVDIVRRAVVGDNQDTVKLRGFDGSRFLVLIDGRPVNSAGVVGGCYVDWGTFPLDNVDKIEVIRGPKSAVYGNTLGGVINIITKQGGLEPYTSLQTMWGSKNLERYQFEHSGKQGNLSYVITAGKDKRDAYLCNNYFDSENYSLKTTYSFPTKEELTVGIQSTKTKRGYIMNNRQSQDPDSPLYYEPIDPAYPLADGESIPLGGPPVCSPNSRAYADKTKTYYDISYRQPTRDGFWKLQWFKNNEDRKDYNYSAADSNKLIFNRKTGTDRSQGWSVQQVKNIGTHKLTYGWEHRDIGYGDIINNYIDPALVAYAYPNELSSEKMDVEGAYLQDEYRANPKLTYLFGLRYDKYEGRSDRDPNVKMRPIDGSAFSPKFEASYQFDSQTVGYLSVNRGYRVPTLPEFYWWSEGYMKNYPDIKLKAEDGRFYEIGLKKKVSNKTNYRISGYYSEIGDYIYNNFKSAGSTNQYMIYNIDKAKIWGFEADGEHKLRDNLSVFANYTYQKTKKQGDRYDTLHLSDELDYHPRDKVNVGFRYTTANNTQIAISARYVGEQKSIYRYTKNGSVANKLVSLPDYTTVNASASRMLNKNTEISLFIDNIFNKGYSETFGYPMEGRTYGISCKYQF